jgi:hypothetical protein
VELTTLESRAEEFIRSNARLIDRRRYEYHLKGGSREAVLAALRGYINPDGGFGQALEPDLRSPGSQPVFQEAGLRVLDEIGFEADVVDGLLRFLPTITTEEGGVPAVLPSAVSYPRAPWWQPESPLRARLMPTGAIAGYLHRNGVDHPWLGRATEFCWRAFEEGEPEEVHDLLCGLVFLEHAPDRERARRDFATVGERILAKGLVSLDPRTEGYVQTPLDWAPRPDAWCRELFEASVIEAHLDALIGRQQEDGGWPISWPPVSAACELEWRGFLTVNALLLLRAYGRLTEG